MPEPARPASAAGTGITIRSATEADVPLILALIRQLAEYERLAHDVTATEADLRASLFDAHPPAEVLIGSVEGTPAGFAVFFQNFSTFRGRPGLYLEDLFVMPEWRGRGLGEMLLRHVAREAVRRNCARFEWAVLDWNAPAIAFYRKLGAELLNDWTLFRVTGEALARLGA